MTGPYVPFLPIPHAQSNEIDAADPGFGGPPSSEDHTRGGVDEDVAADPGPGSRFALPQPDLSDEEVQEQKRRFAERMAAERDRPHLFRTRTRRTTTVELLDRCPPQGDHITM